VEAHIFICFLAYLLAKALELKLRAAGLQLMPLAPSTCCPVYKPPSTPGKSKPSSI
jgi:hypothetical protein